MSRQAAPHRCARYRTASEATDRGFGSRAGELGGVMRKCQIASRPIDAAQILAQAHPGLTTARKGVNTIRQRP